MFIVTPASSDNSHMNIEDMIKGLKALEEWQKSQKPKEEKKEEKKLTFFDQLIAIVAVQGSLTIIATATLLYLLTQYMKAVPH